MKKIYRDRAKNRVKIPTARVKYSSALPGRVDAVAEYQKTMEEIFAILFSDENFLTLLQAEGLAQVPQLFASLAEKARRAYEIR
ncbi:MAG TPA: hypothetical protein VHX60_04880 [Acidobacteriaceae bacterium]|jgi:hypothetical protein|nr:hypothetical protein [Acidobacteriaceae bacterium]